MQELMLNYSIAVICMGCICSLLLLQILIADAISIKNKQTPGVAISAGHDSFLFRSARAAANTNETLAAFIGLLLFALFTQADPFWVNNLALIYLATRIAHMLCYYCDWRLLRSLAFTISYISLVALALLAFQSL